jgi:hypothetical protein
MGDGAASSLGQQLLYELVQLGEIWCTHIALHDLAAVGTENQILRFFNGV